MLSFIDSTLLVPIATVGLCTAICVAVLRRQGNTDENTLPNKNVLWSLWNHWIHLLKSLVSFTLSTSEQSIFEEEFKYLIVTSSLFNETPQPSTEQQKPASDSIQTHSNVKQKQEIKDFSSQRLSFSLVLVNIASLFIIIQSRSTWPVLICADVMTCYFIFRHCRRVQIRKIHASALDSMHEIISLSQESDTILNRLLKITMLSNDQHHQQLGSHLSAHFETFVETVHQLQPLIDASNLARLRDMYNVNDDIPSMLLEFDSHQYKPEDIDLIYAVIGWKRREYLLYLLALDVMSNNRTARYGKIWSQAIQVNRNLMREYAVFIKDISVISPKLVDSTEKSSKENDDTISIATNIQSDTSSTSEETSISDGRCITLMHRVSVVEKQMEDIQAKLFLCKQDTRSLASGRVSSLGLKRISKRFSHIDSNMISLLKQWEESKNSLNSLLEDEQEKMKSTYISLPSPPSSPRDFRHNASSTDEFFMSHMSRNRSQTTPL